MIKDEYSPFKFIHHSDKIDELRQHIQTDPIQIHLIPTNKCNQSCTYCAYRIPESASNQKFNGTDSIPHEKLMETIESCARLGVKAIQYTGGGEPLVYPGIKDAFNKTISLKMDMALVSNGMALNDELIDILADVSWVRISVDAFSKKTYSLIKKVKATCYDTVIKNVRQLASSKKKTVLGIGFVVNRENYDEIYDACSFFKDLGVDNFRISAAFTPLGMNYFKDIYDQAEYLSKKAKRDLEDDHFTVFNLFNDRIKDLFSGTQEYDYCAMKELVPYIGADQYVYTCCILAYNTKGRIGSIKHQSLFDLWKSKEKQYFFAKHSPRIFCRLPCMFENKNDFINYCIKNSPKHINFI